ncbi:MAG TPA: hypothetical protein QGF58_09715 [Myxococcota bacterium]|nr:hypothetical protein [Myxococcota bacterium]
MLLALLGSTLAADPVCAVGRRNLDEPTSWYTRDSAIARTETE